MGYKLAQLLDISHGQLYRIVTEAPQNPLDSQDSLHANIRFNQPNCKMRTSTDGRVCNILLQVYTNFLQYLKDLNNTLN
jgi:hypothetical protein